MTPFIAAALPLWFSLAAFRALAGDGLPSPGDDEKPFTSVADRGPAGAVATPLIARNEFDSPEQVVAYYASRDAAGYVWTGLLDLERRQFTTWKQVPQGDAFYLAKSYQVMPARYRKKGALEAEVAVRYELVGMSDGTGARMPPIRSEHEVVFELEKTEKTWKIRAPAPTRLVPVLFEGRWIAAH